MMKGAASEHTANN